MPAGKNVRPQKWSNELDLYDDGYYSMIWGTYDYSPSRCLGVRWNGDPNDPDDKGFPNQGGNPTWHLEPDWLAKMILLEICARVAKNPSYGNHQNILTALSECP